MEDDAVIDFLQHSNYIEGVADGESLDNAVKAWKYILTQDKLTPENVQKTHDILMKNHLEGDELGKWRTCSVYIGTEEKKKWYALPALMENWCKQANGTVNLEVPPVSLWGYIQGDHVQYEDIHPFIDGNGRTGRIFMNWQRVKAGLPVFVIREEERFDYYKWFKKVDTTMRSLTLKTKSKR